MSLIRKLVSPLLYGLFLLPTCAGIIAVIDFLERNFVLHNLFGRTGDVDGLLALIFIGGLMFLTGNGLMKRLEGLHHPHVVDHFRQCAALYVLFAVATVVLLVCRVESHALGYAYLVLVSAASLWAIFINAIYLYIAHFRAEE